MWDTLYRPQKYSDVLGQDGNVRLLKKRISNGTAFDTSYIFAGGYGRGKTTLSRIHARAMLCQDLDKGDPEPCGQCDNCKDVANEQSLAFTERDAASHGSADAMRAIVEELPYVLANAPKRIYLIDEFQRTSPAAQDVLLKPMEEKLMVAMLATTEPEKIRGAIRSRCEEYTIRKVTRDDILPRMKMVLTEQGVAHEDDAVLIVIDRAEGHVRNVLNDLEMIAQLGPVTVDSVREYLHLSVVTVYYETLLHLDDPLRAIELVAQACEMVPPDDVASGLAEAAMNCYRLARRCFVDFSYVDKDLAARVYEKYQDNVVGLARLFSGRKNVSRLTLELDVMSFSMPASLPEPVVVAAASLPSAPIRTVEPAATKEIPAAVAKAPIAPPQRQPAPKSNAQVAVAPVGSPTAATTGKLLVPDGLTDYEEFTPLREDAASIGMPRQRRTVSRKVVKKSQPDPPLAPNEFRLAIEQEMKK